MRFLENAILFDDPENNRIFKEEIRSSDKNNVMGIDEYVKQEGIKEGMEQGLEKGREESVRLFLSSTDFSDAKIAELVGVPISVVEKVKKGTKN